MLYLDQSLDSPALSLALEEALLDAAEDGEWNDEFLRVWDSNQYFAVIGRGSRISEEVNLEFAAKSRFRYSEGLAAELRLSPDRMSAIRSFAFTGTKARIADGGYCSPVCHANNAGSPKATGTFH